MLAPHAILPRMRWRAPSLVAALWASAAVAQAPTASAVAPPLPPQYEVEIIVFANRDFDPSEERFDDAAGAFAADAAAELRDAPVFDESNFGPLVTETAPIEPADPLAELDASVRHIRPLLPAELKLGNEYRRLQAIPAYRPLLHAGWVQPGLPETEAQPFDLAVLGAFNPRGTVRVHLSRFLHITLDLTYQATATPTVAPVASNELTELAFAPSYRLQATRSARSGELHYIDHPAFGVLVKITPLPAPDSNAAGQRPAA